MRPQNQIARDRLDMALRQAPPKTAVALAQALGVSVPSIHRMVRERGADVVRQGITKSAKYALRRTLRGKAAPLPIYRIDVQGRGEQMAELDLIAPQGALLDLAVMGWPTLKTHHGWWGGLPYPLYDMRPQGFLGRNFAHQIALDFAVSENPEDWSDDDIAYVLSVRGVDCVGNLIVGDAAYQQWLKWQSNLPESCNEADLPTHYAQLAERATSLGGVGSSAGGEFPKFTASRSLANSQTLHVIVKFSGVNIESDTVNAVQRWSDLLICEHLALIALAQTTDVTCANSRIVFGQGRTFLEVERFDRIGALGRSAVISLASLDAAFIGAGRGAWPDLVQRLADMQLLNTDALRKAELIAQSQTLWWYGKLIANSDMHLGNLSFMFDAETTSLHPSLQLSPVYDMLPMLYAPLAGGEVPKRSFEPPLPLPREENAWQLAYQAALNFWQLASEDARISLAFRQVCYHNLQTLVNIKPK
jgi:hypothetical protein